MFDNKTFIIIYSILIGIVFVFISFKRKMFYKVYDESALVLLESLIISLFLSIIYFNSHSINDFINNLSKISKKDWILLLLIAATVSFSTIVGTKLLKANDISYLTTLDTVLDVVLTFIISYLFYKEKITIKKMIGIFFVLLGIFFVH